MNFMFEWQEQYLTSERSQYSPVRLELARLVSSLLYGTLGWSMLVCFLLKRTSGHLNSKGVFDDKCVFDDASN